MDPILIVDDDPLVGASLAKVLGRLRPVQAIADARDAQRWLDQHRPALVILDLSLSDPQSEQVALRARDRHGANVPVLVLSASNEIAARAKRVGAAAYLAKPFEVDELLRRVQGLLDG